MDKNSEQYKIFVSKMQECIDVQWDKENAHIKADIILCDMLTLLGYDEIVEMFYMVDKWYA